MSGIAAFGQAGDVIQDTVPSTFEERGTTIPFTTPELAYCRLRRGSRGSLEVLVNGFSGGRCTYVFPWASIPQVVRLTLHDKALHAEISYSDATTPDKIRMAAYRVARTGLGGPEMIELANKSLEREATEKLSSSFFLMLKVIEATSVNTDRAALALININSPEGRGMVRQAFRRVGESIGITPEACHQRILELSEIIQPIGFEIEGQRGRLRQLLHRLSRFRDEVIRADSGGTTRTLAEVAQLTMRIGNAILNDVDRDIANVIRFVAEWDARVTSTRQNMERLSWLLDGWGQVCDLWDGTDEDKTVGRHQRINEIMRIIPLVPRSESQARIHVEPTDSHRRQNRIVQQNEDWRTGQMDSEMSARLGKLQARKQT
jgi:DNA-binding Lrp family transcriptional regulator